MTALSSVNPQEVAELLRQTAAKAERLLKENAELKAQLKAVLADPPPTLDTGGEGLQTGGSDLKSAGEAELRLRFQSLEKENREFATRYVEIEEENNNLANLYVASYQLHSTLDFREVLRIITEIAINLIGAEQFGIYLLDEKTQTLTAVAAEGVEREVLPKVPLGQGLIGRTAESGENHFPEEMQDGPIDYLKPHICIPLKIKDKVIGVIAIYRFLKQKTHLQSVDYELFTLLAGHAATALFSSKLYSESERKLSTIQGFLELMTS